MSQHAVIVASLIMAIAPAALADDRANAIINKAIEAMGGEERLAEARAMTISVRSSVLVSEAMRRRVGWLPPSAEGRIEHTTDGLDRIRSTYKNDFRGRKRRTVIVVDGDKVWEKNGQMEVREMEGQRLADYKWGRFSQSTDIMLLSLKEKDSKFTTEAVGDEKVGDAPAVGVMVTGPAYRDFTIYFNKESGLPVKVVADMPSLKSPGKKWTQETYFSDYKDFGGIKRATKVELKRDGQTFIKEELLDVKVLDKVDDKTFAKPE